MAIMYDIAFWRLSKIRRPRRIAATIDAKSSSRRTSDEASRATSVPLFPIAMPMSAALSAGASLTPSPVIATISLFAFRAWTMRSFWSGTTRAKIFTFSIFSASSASLRPCNSLPSIISQSSERPIWCPMLRAVAGKSPVIIITLMPAS